MASNTDLPKVINLPMTWEEFHLAILIFDRFAAERNGDLGQALTTSMMLDAFIDAHLTNHDLNKFLTKIATLHDATCHSEPNSDHLGL